MREKEDGCGKRGGRKRQKEETGRYTKQSSPILVVRDSISLGATLEAPKSQTTVYPKISNHVESMQKHGDT
jgi:hypothetical protein